MRHIVIASILAATSGISVSAQTASPQLTPDQKGYIAYDRCMMHAAIKTSHTDAKDEEIFGLAKASCAPTRSAVIVGQEDNREYLAALDAADADKSARFPAWIKGVRERRKAFEAQAAAPVSTPRQ